MKYEEIVAKVKEILNTKDISDYQKHLTLQINITGEGEGIFYIEFKDGKINVEPYNYYDNDAIVTISADNLLAILNGSLDTTVGFCDNCFTVSTNLGIVNEFSNVIKEAKEIVPVVKSTKKTTENAKTITVDTSNVEPVKVDTPKVETVKTTTPKSKTTTKTSTKKASTTTKKKTTSKKK